MPARRVIIIGLDGADEYILNRLIDSGRCPNISTIKSNGYFGSILSTVPPLTPPAWTTMLTSLNPGRHGVFDFIQPSGDGRFVVANASRRTGRTLFDRCIAQGAGVLDLFVPFTFPPPDDGAVHISGLGTPSWESDFIRPHSLRDSMLERYPGLKELDLCEGRNLATLAGKLLEEVAMKSAIAKELMGDTGWRLAMVVFNATDLAQHFYLKYFDERHPHYDGGGGAGYGDAITDVYSRCDQFIGECMEHAADGDVIAIVSDHGCQPLTSSIAKDALLKDILQSSGLLTIRRRRDDDRPGASADIAHRGIHAIKKYTPHAIRNAFNALFGGAKEKVSKALEAVPFGDDIDWTATKAFVGPGSYGVGVYVNTRGRFPNGIVEPGGEEESVKDRVLDIVGGLRLPDGAPLAAYAAKREDIFWGEMMHLAPDIVCLFAEPGGAFDGAQIADGIFLPGPEKRAGTDLVWSGTHSLRGIFGLWGNGIARGRVADNASLADISPTILHVLGLAISEGLDGRIIREADQEGREPRYVTEEGEICAASKGLTPEQEKDIYEKLKSVGYFH